MSEFTHDDILSGAFDYPINWVKKGSYQVNGYDQQGDLIYTLKNKWALGWWYLYNEWKGYEVGQFDYPSLKAYARAEEDYKSL